MSDQYLGHITIGCNSGSNKQQQRYQDRSDKTHFIFHYQLISTKTKIGTIVYF